MITDIQSPRGRANIINFCRFDHGMATLEGQMWEILKRGLPATWLLQYDALTAGPYVDFFKTQILPHHEIGLWFEVNRRQCDDAGVHFNGEIPDPLNTFDTENWDHHAQAMMPCGYDQNERMKLIDTMMRTFFKIFGRFPASVCGWYIDSFSLRYLVEKYHICASANCKDQWNTDGYSLWGAPYHAFYYPSKVNAIMPGSNRESQISVPIFRMLGNDPVNACYLDSAAGGQPVYTLEPNFPKKQANLECIRRYFDMVLAETTRPFPYFQIGEENSYPWEKLKDAYSLQLDELVRRQEHNQLIIETLEKTGQYVQAHYRETPIGVLHAHTDPTGDTKTIWYHSKSYRCQILYSPTRFEIVDLYRYSSNEMENHFCEPVCTWSSTFMAMPIVDSFLFGSRWFLTGTRNGQSFDERNLPIHNLAINVHDDILEVSYTNDVGIRSRLSFTHDCIQLERLSDSNVCIREALAFDPQSRWNPIQGIYRNNVVFNWNNYDYRITVKENLPVFERDKSRVLLRTLGDTRECTTTVFLYPCVTAECLARPCRE